MGLCHVPLSDNRLVNSNCLLYESSSLLMPRITLVRLCHVPCAAERQQAHELELLTERKLFSINASSVLLQRACAMCRWATTGSWIRIVDWGKVFLYNDPDCDTSFQSFSVSRAQAYAIIIENFGTVWFAYVPLARQICRRNSPKTPRRSSAKPP